MLAVVGVVWHVVMVGDPYFCMLKIDVLLIKPDCTTGTTTTNTPLLATSWWFQEFWWLLSFSLIIQGIVNVRLLCMLYSDEVWAQGTRLASASEIESVNH